ncbi:MOSC domain-containing protein [Micromonospora sp. HUAS LYJ1]|uniref:MOSC domain-containing protein n=1 Tax=Micromonospora sp. HUAS LYJ1 TaxID=3061626 RepID=UPI00267380A9|nr:MOSC domain-containing protein [Micromonospora sp. HUAS LYJ1]WKU05963.1 MOSC domain-containing protein [Micromonospora sp. HUAS LYJ1]
MPGRLTELWRYPVKSMLGEALRDATVDGRGVAGDRRLAVLDHDTGRVGSAKRPRRWSALLGVRATGDAPDRVRLTLPDGTVLDHPDAGLDAALSRLLGREVTLTGAVPADALLDRADPDAVLAEGADVEVPVTGNPLGDAAPPGSLVDFAPVHLVTTASLDALDLPREAVPRYRPNLVVATDARGFVENDWVGRDLRIGAEVVLRVLAPTPRCAVPTLAHGPLPRAPQALRWPAERNRVAPVPGLGPQPCVGAYAVVVRGGRVAVGDRVEPT